MSCPLCGSGKARRACPALGRRICPVCCGTKRMNEIRCPSDCSYLASAREHPPALVVRQQERDFGVLVRATRDFSHQQSELFFTIATFIARYQPAELQPLVDTDVEDASGALAATFETASRGVIYEHRAASAPAERFALAIKPLLAEAAGRGGAASEREAGAVLRRVVEVIREIRQSDPGNHKAFIDLLGRMVRRTASPETRPAASEAPRLILP